MPFALYRVGEISPEPNFIRSALHPYGLRSHDVRNPVVGRRYAVAWGPTASLDAAELDPEVIALSPQSSDQAAAQNWLDQPHTWTVGQLATLEADFVDTDLITASTTRRAIIRTVIQNLLFVQQVLHNFPNALEFLQSNLDTQVSALNASTRTAVQDWLEGKGIDTSWIVGSTSVREVLQGIRDRSNDLTTYGLRPYKKRGAYRLGPVDV